MDNCKPVCLQSVKTQMKCCITVADPEGVQGVCSNLAPVFKYPMKMKKFGLSETKLFYFHRIFKKNETR